MTYCIKKKKSTSKSNRPTTEKTFLTKGPISAACWAGVVCALCGISLHSIRLSLENPSVSSRSRLYFCCLKNKFVLTLIRRRWWAVSSFSKVAAASKLNSKAVSKIVTSTRPLADTSFTRWARSFHLDASAVGSVWRERVCEEIKRARGSRNS